MNNREIAKNLIDQISETKLLYVISYLQGAALSDEVLNAETIESIKELENGGGFHFSGSTKDLFAELEKED